MSEKIYAKYLGGDLTFSSKVLSGFLLLTSEAVSYQGRLWQRFKGYSATEELLRISISSIEDVETSKVSETSAIGMGVGVPARIPVAGTVVPSITSNVKSTHNLVKITYRDSNGILQHPQFETDKAEVFARALYDLRVSNKQKQRTP